MKKPLFYQAVLKPVTNVLEHVYPHLLTRENGKYLPTMTERMGSELAECPQCPDEEWLEPKPTQARWMLLAPETQSVEQGGKPYIECLNCGYLTHL